MTAEEAAARIAAALRERTGRAWDVRPDRRTRAARNEGWLVIRAPLRRWETDRRGRRRMRDADIRALAEAFGVSPGFIPASDGWSICDEDYVEALTAVCAPAEETKGSEDDPEPRAR